MRKMFQVQQTDVSASVGAERFQGSEARVTRPVHADCPVRFGWPAASVKAPSFRAE